MLTISDVVENFHFYDPYLKECAECKTKPIFRYQDTLDAYPIIRLGCYCKNLESKISLIQMQQMNTPRMYIRGVLSDMVNTWNKEVDVNNVN